MVLPEITARERLGQFAVFDVYKQSHRFRRGDKDDTFDAYCLEMPDWVTVVALRSDGSIVLIRQLRFGVNEVMLETPGGVIDAGESAEAAAARELREETGYVGGEISSLGWVHPNPAIQNNRIHLMLARGVVASGELDLDEHEDTETVIVTPQEVDAALRTGAIRHALSALALERALRHTDA